MSKDLESRVIELESIVSYQDQMLEDLNNIVISQQKEIDKLLKDFDLLKQSVANAQEEMNDKPPPHY